MNQTFNHLGNGMSGVCLAGSADTQGAFSLFRVDAELGANIPPHVHQFEDELFYILEGTFRLQLGNRLFAAGKGEVVYLPRTIVHSFECTSETGGTLLVMTLPGGFEKFFAELDAFGPLPMPPSAADIEGFLALLRNYRMTPAAPAPEGTLVEKAPVLPYPPVDLGDHRGYVKIAAHETDGALLLTEVEADYRGRVPPHIHTREDETFYVLEGTFTFGIGEATVIVGPGECVYGPRGVKHTWRCDSSEGGRMLIYFTPGENFQSFGMAMGEKGMVPSAPKDPVAFLALAERFGITMLF